MISMSHGKCCLSNVSSHQKRNVIQSSNVKSTKQMLFNIACMLFCLLVHYFLFWKQVELHIIVAKTRFSLKIMLELKKFEAVMKTLDCKNLKETFFACLTQLLMDPG